jgi:hypothetical protein
MSTYLQAAISSANSVRISSSSGEQWSSQAVRNAGLDLRNWLPGVVLEHPC